MGGRVRLSDFYNKSMYSHWELTEKPDYLRALGALDESNPSMPLVIIPNYVGARQNCLEASNIFAVCCRNECENLMGRLESEIGEPQADPSLIAKIVASMPSEEKQVLPRELPGTLLQRLKTVSEKHGGRVSIHGRLFAQWMHHAFPRECPYPHEAGTTNPMSPDQWMKETGQDSCKASESEMRTHVASDGSIGSLEPNGASDVEELPWTQTEELLVTTPMAKVEWESSFSAIGRRGIAIVVVVVATLILAWIAKHGKGFVKDDHFSPIGYEQRPANRNSKAHWTIIAFGVFATFSLATDLLDATVFACVFTGGLLVLILCRFLLKRSPASKKL